MHRTPRISAEAFEDWLPGELLKEHRAQSAGDVLGQILSRRRPAPVHFNLTQPSPAGENCTASQLKPG